VTFWTEAVAKGQFTRSRCGEPLAVAPSECPEHFETMSDGAGGGSMESKKDRKAAATSYVFVAPDPGRAVMRVAAVAALVGLVAGVTLTVADGSLWAMIVAAVAAVLLVVLWAMMQSKIPQRITVRGSTIQIRRDGRVDEFDLEDPNVDIRVSDGEIAFAHYMDRWVVVRSRDVDWKVFSDVVMHYQNKADEYAEQRDRRFNS
jgi:hypothetical protein